MQLLAAHQILIAAAIALAALFGARSLVSFSQGAGAGSLALGLVSLVVGAALALYLRRVRARWLAQQGGRDR